MFSQLQSFLAENSMFETFQSGFRKCHSTETALLKVLNDILISCDSVDFAVLVLLDLTAAFDTVDHAILIDRLEHCIGLRGIVLYWFKSYLANRSFSVKMGEHYSRNASLTCRVPQGSILSPLLFPLYMLPLGLIVLENMDCHFTVMRMILRFICLLNEILWNLSRLWHVWRM